VANYRLRIGHANSYPLAAQAGSYLLSGQNATLTYSPAPSSDPFAWYPALDKSTIPFHVGSGEWGPQSTIDEPVAPTITTNVTAANNAELASHIYTPGRRITLTGNITASAWNAANISDIEVIVPPGITWHEPSLGGGGSNRTVTRMVIRGSTLGTYSGGQITKLDVVGTGSDLVIDGVAITSTYLYPAVNFGPAAGFSRGAVTNCRVISGGIGVVGTCSDFVVAGCSILTGMDTAAQTDQDHEEAYGIRFYNEVLGNAIVYACDIRSNPSRVQSSHARVRCHPRTGLDYVWVSSNRLVERVENWMFMCDADAGGGNDDARAVWLTNLECISAGTGSTGGAGVPKMLVQQSPLGTGSRDTDYFYVQSCTFKSNAFTSNSSITGQGGVNGSSGISGNTYTTLPGSDPSWGTALVNGVIPGAGDPSSISWSTL